MNHMRARLTAAEGARDVERIVGGRGAVVVEPENHAGEMGVIRFGTAELIVRQIAGRARAVGQVLQLSATAIVADVDVEFVIRTEANDAAVVIAPERPAGIGLKRVKVNEVGLEAKR